MTTGDQLPLGDLAGALLHAETERRPVAPIVEDYPAVGPADAYEVQRLGRAMREQDGRRLVGRKVGLTSEAMQTMLGVDQPDFGYLLDDMVHDSGAVLSRDAFIAPRIEGEIAFRLRADLAGPDVTLAQVLAATDAVAPAIEVIDSRIADWRISFVDTVADNASCGCAVIGSWTPLHDLATDLAEIEMEAGVGDERVTGLGSAVLGHPAEPVAWLARTLHGFGEGLSAGDIVLPGALARAIPVAAGQRAVAHFATLGDVEVTFS